MKTIEQGIEDKKNKTEDVRTLDKLGENHYKLTITNEGQRICNVKEFSKKELKEVYEDLKQNIANIKSLRTQQKDKAKMLLSLPEEEQEKIEEFMHLLNQVKEYQDAEKAKTAIPNMDKQIDLLSNSKKEIELAIPEVLRNK